MNSQFSSGKDYWAHVDLAQIPDIKTDLPGPESIDMHARCTKYFKGLSGQVKLFPVAFESGYGCMLTDVDGNRYIDFSSGIYVTTLGHCHPKVTEAIIKATGKLQNAHDFTSLGIHTDVGPQRIHHVDALSLGQFPRASSKGVRLGR